MAEPREATARVDVVLNLLEQWRLKQSEKKSVFGTNLQCVRNLFARMHPIGRFCQHMVAEIESRWTVSVVAL